MGVAQSVEHATFNHGVESSSLSTHIFTDKPILPLLSDHVHVAWLLFCAGMGGITKIKSILCGLHNNHHKNQTVREARFGLAQRRIFVNRQIAQNFSRIFVQNVYCNSPTICYTIINKRKRGKQNDLQKNYHSKNS